MEPSPTASRLRDLRSAPSFRASVGSFLSNAAPELFLVLLVLAGAVGMCGPARSQHAGSGDADPRAVHADGAWRSAPAPSKR